MSTTWRPIEHAYSVADELAFTALPEETQALVRKLVAGGYFPEAALFTREELDEAREEGRDEGYTAGYDEGYEEGESADRYEEGYDDVYEVGLREGRGETAATPP